MKKDEVFWKNKLDKFSYSILREAGTEMPFSGKYNMFFEEGYYKCKGCGNKLFDSKSTFNSGCGWPSFDKCIDGSIIYKEDKSLSRIRTEILCAECNGHLGHVFEDGPTETGARYCVNSASLNFNKK